MAATTTTQRVLIDAFDGGLEIEVDRGSGWEPWQGNHYHKSWGFRIHYPEGLVVEVQSKE